MTAAAPPRSAPAAPAAEPQPTEDQPGRRTRQPDPGRGLFLASTIAAIAPILVAAVHGIRRGYLPAGDDAYFAIRAGDVLTSHAPQVGMATSVSTGADAFNNPGPLLFDIWALPTRLLPAGAGLVLGVTLLNVAAVVGVAAFAYRRGGTLLGVLAMTVSAALGWTLGTAVLYDPTQPSSLLLPFLCLLMAVWSITCGDVIALPWGVALASLLVQSYLTYGYLVALLVVWAVVGLSLRLRAERRQPHTWPKLRRRLWRAGALAAIVLVVLWAQPVAQELTDSGDGNLTRIAQNLGGPPEEPLGYEEGVPLAAVVVAIPPFWLRPSFERFLAANDPGAPFGTPTSTMPSPVVADVLLALVVAALAACLWAARRHRDLAAGRVAITAVVALAATLVTLVRMPVGVFGLPTAHTFRWLWPTAAFVTFALAAGLLRRARPSWRRPVLATLTVLAVGFALANLPFTNQGASEEGSANAPMRDIARQMDVLDGRGPLLITPPAAFAEPYSEAVWAQLARDGIPFVTDDPVLVQQLGSARRFNGKNARSRLLVKRGDASLFEVPGARLVAFHDGLDRSEQAELRRLKDDITANIGDQGVPLSAQAERLVAAGQLPPIPQQPLGGPDVGALFNSRSLAVLVEGHLLDLDRRWEKVYDRFAELQTKSDDQTVGLLLAPLAG